MEFVSALLDRIALSILFMEVGMYSAGSQDVKIALVC